MKNILLAAVALVAISTAANAATPADKMRSIQLEMCAHVGVLLKETKTRADVAYAMTGLENTFIRDLYARGVNGENVVAECTAYAPVIFASKFSNGAPK